jgi:N-acetylmuramoyl-L-alanine amidase
MTRSDDEYVGLTARAEISNRADADAFISYHFNSADSESANGFEIFTTPAQNNSDKLAAKIWSAHRKQLPEQRDRGLKEANFTVIKKANCPAVLVEGEFIHTPAGEAFITQNKQAMAHAVADGVLAYLGLDTAPVLTLEQRVDRIEEHLNI